MTTPIIYLYDRCSTCQKALKWLDSQGYTYETRPIKEALPSLPELQLVATSMGEIRKLFNSSGMLYREMGLSAELPALSEDKKYALLQSDGMLIRRPFLVVEGTGGWAGFREKQWGELLSEEFSS